MIPAIRKLAITSEGPSLSDAVDPRFGRAAGFLLVDLLTQETHYVDNGSSQALAQGAGIQAAENLAQAGAQALLTGHVGPKAWTALQAAGIRVAQGADNMSAGEALEQFKTGKFPFSDDPSR